MYVEVYRQDRFGTILDLYSLYTQPNLFKYKYRGTKIYMESSDSDADEDDEDERMAKRSMKA